MHPESGELLHPTSAKLQALAAFDEALRAVEGLGGRKEDVVRVRMYVKERGDCGGVGEALKETFGGGGWRACGDYDCWSRVCG